MTTPQRSEPTALGEQTLASAESSVDANLPKVGNHRTRHGATSGIGKATAVRFVGEGATVVLAGRRADLGNAIAAYLGTIASFRTADVSVEEDVRALVTAIHEQFGHIDCLFNNAGGPGQTGGIDGLDVDRFDATFGIEE